MVTIQAMNEMISKLAEKLKSVDVYPRRILLFGSYAKGTPHVYSDVDLAIWAKGFKGIRSLDIEKIAPAMRDFNGFEIHPFTEFETIDENPFIEEIERYGIDYSHLISKQPLT